MGTSNRTPMWAKLLLGAVIAAVAAGGGLLAGKWLSGDGEQDVQTTRFVTPEDDVILMSAGVAGIDEEREDPKAWGWLDVPGNERVKFIQYEFTAKLGIDGGEVKIDSRGDGSYEVSIPEFISLGIDDPDVRVATESDGLLSWATPDIDKMETLKRALSDKAMEEQIEKLRPLMELQATRFYSTIIKSVNPDAELSFTFSDGTTKAAD